MHTFIQQSTLHISGNVTVHTLNADVCRQFAQQCAQPEILYLDGSQIERADSAALSLIFTAQRARQGSLKPLTLQNWPKTAKDLAQLYDIQEWINT